jgi:uncharacterized repeat protein (TIGR03803 family)
MYLARSIGIYFCSGVRESFRRCFFSAREEAQMPAKLSVVIAISGLLIMVNPVRAADRYQGLHAFRGTDGGNSYAGLVFDTVGNLYGTTHIGGAYDVGTVFELTPDTNGKWTEKVLYSFCSASDCTDGAFPGEAGLVLDSSGNLYGETAWGGGSGHEGVVFELSPTAQGQWTETPLYSFATYGSEGIYPDGGLVFDSKGNLYGTTVFGGSGNWGTVFELTPDGKGGWTATVLHTFEYKDGANPYAGLIFDAAGNLYGVAPSGGGQSCAGGCGTAFRLTPSQQGKWSYKVIHFFDGKNGAGPEGGLIFDMAGNLYGTTTTGGAYSGCFNGGTCGTVFELMPRTDGRWVEKVLHNFNGRNGSYPVGGVISDTAGNLYGTTVYGGDVGCAPPIGCGTVFKLSPNADGKWVETILRAFFVEQKFPLSRLVFDNAENLYGTTRSGGIPRSECELGCGLVFELGP